MGRHSGDFLVRPLDTVWFRGNHPFVAGEDSTDAAQFPPSPWSFQGLVRTRLLLATLPGDLDQVDPATIAALVGTSERLPEGWRLEGPFPARRYGGQLEPWFPAPRFLLKPSEVPKGRPPVRAGLVPTLASLLTDVGSDPCLLGSPRDGGEALSGWISASNLEWALTGAGAWAWQAPGCELPPFVAIETRAGVRVEFDTATAADHMLFVAHHHRFETDSGLLGRLTATTDSRVPDDALWRSWTQVGRKGRLVELTGPETVSPAWERLRSGTHLTLEDAAVPDPLQVWVVLLTPAMVTDSRPPFDLPEHPVQARALGHLTAQGPDLGGFDRTARGGRPVRATWAAGSCWRVELAGGSAEERLAAARELQGLPPHVPDALEALGFGQRVVGWFDPDTFLSNRGGIHA